MDLRKRRSNLLIIVVVLFFSCEKEELPIQPHEQGDELTNEVTMEEDYRNQIFFDLGTNSVVASNLKTEWDLAFESSPTDHHIILNTSKGMAVHRSNEAFADVTSHTGLDWVYDAHSGNLDSTAIGDWQTNQKLYVIDRGYDHTGSHQGYFKIEILNVTSTEFEILIGDIGASTGISQTITKTTEQFTYFSLENGVVNIAPPDLDYDIIFTQYLHIFTDPLTPYLVTGVLLNRDYTCATLYEEKSFSEITIDDATAQDLSYELHVIGYDWKYYDLGEDQYTVYPDMVFIIKTSSDYYYKFHFVGFYNDQGIKGYPTFEFQQL